MNHLTHNTINTGKRLRKTMVIVLDLIDKAVELTIGK